MHKRAVVGGKVLSTPNYDDAKLSSKVEILGAEHGLGVDRQMNTAFVKEAPSNRLAAYRELVARGVNGEVPLARAMVNAGLRASGGVLNGAGKQTAWFAARAANDNEQSRMAA